MLATLAALASACAPRPAEFRTAEALPSAPRRTDGVAFDLASAPLAAGDRASSASGFAALRPPIGADTALGVVGEFFERVANDDAAGLAALLTSDAIATPPGKPEDRSALATWWEQRLKRLDYTRGAGVALYRASDVRVLPDPSPSEAISVRVRVAAARAGQARLFGDELTFGLRPDGRLLRIYRITEDFQLP